jgi:uncharacterized protein
MKIEPVTSTGRPLITAFGAGGFRFGLQSGDLRIEGAILVLADTPTPWDCGEMATWKQADMASILSVAGQVEFLLLGTGNKMTPPPPFLRALLRDHGMGLEVMDTSNACRTYNHLASEGRHFAAALLPVGTALA